MGTPSNAGGRASWKSFQANHTIPRELFQGADRPKLIQLLQSLPDYLTALNLDGPDNLQPLPANVIPDGSAIHNGSHPGMTSIVKERLDGAWNAFYQANRADIDALAAGSTDPATQARVRTAVAGELRGHIEDFQFKSTNFMDVGDGVGRRMIFNSRDLAYLQTTPTWTAATPEERAAALRGDSKTRTALIERHNRLVAQAPLSDARELEQKVLRELGDGALMHYDGKPATRDAIRALIADAGAHGVDLNNVDAKVYMQAVEDRLNLNPQLQALNGQIDNLTAQIATAPPSQRAALLAERATRISERAAIYEAEIIGSAEIQANANALRRAVAGGLTSGGRPATAVAVDLLKKLGVKLIPVVNVLDTAMTIYEFMSFANEMGLRHSPTYRGAANGLHQFLTGRDIDLAAYARYDHGGEAIAIVADGGVIVYASRLTAFQEWTVYMVNAVEAFGSVIQWSANKLLGALITLTGDQSRRTYAAQAIERTPDGFKHVAAEEAPIEDMDLSVHLEEETTLDVGGNETGSSSSASAVKDDARYELNFAGIGAIFGSNLARLLRITDPWAGLAASTVLSQLGRTFGAAIDSEKVSLEDAFRELPGQLEDAGIGAVSSYLFAELVNELGLTGDAAAALSSTGGAAIAQIAINLNHGELWNKDLTASVANAAGAFVGTWLASQLVEFDTIEGQIGAALGSSIGAYVGISAATGAKLGGTWGNIAGPIGALVGAFLGYIFGGAIGSLFAATPKSGADLAWDASTRQFGVTWSWARGGASRDTARAVAQGAAEALNAVIAMSQASVADARAIRVGAYGTHEKNFVFRITDPSSGKTITAFKARDVQQVLNYGLALATADLLPRLTGGNVFVKRALLGTYRLAGLDPNAIPFHAAGRIPDPAVLNVAVKFDINALLGNMNTALDYTAYLQDAQAIRSIMAQEPDSAFTAMWTVTLARAWELGLHRRAATDWTGGWNVFMDEALGGMADGTAFSPSLLEFGFDPGTNERLIGFYDGDGNATGVLADTIDTASKDHILGTEGADTITVATDRIANTSGLTINGEAATGATHVIRVAARIEGGLGNDTIIAGDLGNDVLGGDGNDTLVGGKLDDWLLGDAGNDRLFAGAANYQFTDGNAAATAAALNVTSSGDMLDGGDGDDALYGSLGSDWLRGGDGVDTIYGGAGGDIIDGGPGNDQGSGGTARLFGGGGTDQYVFSYGSGIDVLFDESDNAATPGSTGDSLYDRLQAIAGGTLQRNWAGGGNYEIDGSVKGGEDAIAFGIGIGFDDLILQRSGTATMPGQDLIIYLTAIDPVSSQRLPTGDQLMIKDWFETTRRVEWLRFADGQEIRIGDVRSFVVGTGASDVIFGTNAADFIVGDSGNNVIRGLGGDDFGFAGAGDDMIAGDADNDLVTGGDGNDSVLGGLGNDTAFGDAGTDRVYGGGGSDILAGGRGDDEIIAGDGDDIIRFERGDGSDVVFDALVNNWELVWQAGTYLNGYTLNTTTGVVTKDGEVVFDGSQWIGTYDYVDTNLTFYRHLGPVAGALAGNSGTDYLEFGIGIDIQDLMLRRNGSNLEIAITNGDGDGRSFEAVADRITIRDWYLTGNSLEYFVFAATGRHDVFGWTLSGLGTNGADTIAGTAGVDWITGNEGDDVITGDAGADILSGNSGADTLRGGTENDVLFGGDGDDVLEGGSGTDHLVGGSGVDIASYATASPTAIRAFLSAPGTNSRDAAGDVYNSIEGLEGTAGTDRLGGDADANILRGLGGNDTLYGGAGDDVYEINSANLQDTIIDAPFVTNEVVSASGVFNSSQYTATWTYLGFLTTASGDRYCYRLVVTSNATGEEIYRSRDQVDFIYTTDATRPLPAASSWPSANAQWRNGAARTNNGTQVAHEVLQTDDGGSDTIEFGTGIVLSNLTFQRLNGNADLRITYSTNNFVTITGQNDPNRAIETLQLADGLVADLTRLVIVGETATAAGDLVVGDANANTLDGLDGDDVLSGANGTDTLRGGEGDDILEGGASGDVLDGGNDSITAGLAPSSTDQTEAYGDTIRYVGSSGAVTIDLAARTAGGGHASGDTIVAVGTVSTIENVVGSSSSGDTLRGDARANRLSGLGGNDTLEGREGEDVLVGGAGDDTLRGGDGDDNVAGEDGNDIIEGGNQNDLLAGGSGVDQIQGDSGEDVLSGGDGDDTLRGGTENDRLGGDAGNDQLFGEAGNDQLVGGDGNDTLTGGDGDDVLGGEQGNDQLLGEVGNDTYVFDATSGSDTIVDASGLNRIAISGVTPEQIWLTRSGNDLRIGVIGGSSSSTSITIQNYYAATIPTRMREVALETHSLFLAYAEQLIQDMTQNSPTVPVQVPEAIAETLSGYWHEGGRAAPSVSDQTLATNEDTLLSGTVVAVDHDENIVSYTIARQGARGVVQINTATGAWTYLPQPNLYGQDTFDIQVTDADGNSATQTVAVNVASVNDAPSGIGVAGAPAGIDERDHPITGTVLNPVVLGTLSATDVDAPDAGDFASHVFSVTDSRFEIVSGNVLRLRAGQALDFEAGSTVTVAVTVTDRNGAGLSFTQNFTYTVNNRDDYFYGTAGNDTITGQAGRNLIYGQGGNDTLTGANANDDLDGGDGTDNLFGQGGNDTLLGGLGDDVLDAGSGVDTLRGGDGVDTLRGQDGADQLFGDVGNDLLQGGLLNDQLDGGADNDRLEGGDGADTLNGGTGDDTLIGGTGADTFLGGSGLDTVSYETATAGVTVNVTTTTGSAGDAAGDVFSDSIERLVGSGFGDTITGSAANETLEGGAGNDTIYGGAGNDTLLGGDGNDTLDAQSGNDMLNGGAGSDILIGGDDSDTYLLDINSGADEIRNFDPNGTDIDVVGYQGITHEQLWFQRSAVDPDDLVVYVVGTSVQTTIKDWYLVTTASERANYQIDFFLAGERVSDHVNAEALVTLMAGYTRPTTQAAFDTLRATPAFGDPWNAAWNPNAAPVVPTIANQTINEDGTLTLSIAITDDVTPAAGITVTVQAVRADNPLVEDLTLVNAPTISAPDGAGNRTLTVTTRPNQSGQVGIKVTAIDGGGVPTERLFLLTINAVADTPTVTVAQAATPTAPLTKPTLDSGWWALNLQAALVDQDGSETLEVRIANVPAGITFNAGTNTGGGVWSFTPAQLTGLRIQGAATWAQDLALSVTAVSRETATQQTATSAPTALNIVINARPTDITPNVIPAIAENLAAGTQVVQFDRTDADAGDTGTYTLVNSAGGLFSLAANGRLTTTQALNYEAAPGGYTIRVRVTDSGGLTFERDFTVPVSNVNEAPTNISVSSGTLSVAETTGASSSIAVFTAADPENNVTSYTLTDSAGGRFQIASNGQLATGSTPTDYETAGTNNGVRGYSITVRATDAGGLTRDQSFWVAVTPVDEVPSMSGPQSFTIYEGANGGPGNQVSTTAGQAISITGTDPDGSALRYEIVGGNSMFTINSTTGALIQQGVTDYESTTQNYTFTVRGWDGGSVGAGNSATRTVTLQLANLNEGPRVVAGASRTVFMIDPIWGGYDEFLPGVVLQDPEGNAIQSVTSDGGWPWFAGDISGTALVETHRAEQMNLGIFWMYPVDIQVTATDVLGASTTTLVRYLAGGSAQILGPVVLDLDADGVELIAMEESTVRFDMDNDGQRDHVGWVGADDALLVLDRNGDGMILQGAEISFTGDLAGAQSDLEGLAAFDTDNDGSLDVDDEQFAAFQVWRDANQDGFSQAGELGSLTDHGITAIDLTRTLTGEAGGVPGENALTATSEFLRGDGTSGTVGDVLLGYQSLEITATIIESSEIDSQEDIPPQPADATNEPEPAPAASPSAPVIDIRMQESLALDTWRGGGWHGDRGSAGVEVQEPAIDEIDRSSNDPLPASLRPRVAAETIDWRFRSAEAELPRAAEESASQPSTPDDTARRASEPQRAVEPNRGRLADWELRDVDASAAEPQFAVQPLATHTALHADLDSITRRRLQMIEAIATFSAEGAADLSLQPQRRVDARTLELLTSVPTVRVA